MKAFTCAASLLFSVNLAAQIWHVGVHLKTNPVDEAVKGAPITLTAGLGKDAASYDASRLRYTFTAQRSWPTTESFTIAQNATAATVTWTPPKAGIYEFVGNVTYLPPPKGPTPSAVGPPPGPVGNAHKQNYKVKPVGFKGTLTPTFTPPTGATAPVNVKLTLKATYIVYVNTPPFGQLPQSQILLVRLIAHVVCRELGRAPVCDADGQSAAVCSYTLPSPGRYMFFADVDEIEAISNEWVGSGKAMPLGSYVAH
jgi:hypothetical protein